MPPAQARRRAEAEFGAAPDEGVADLVFLPEKQRALLRMVADLVHRRRIEEAAVDHHLGYVFSLADVVQGVAVEDDEVGEFTGFKRAEVAVARYWAP